MRITIAAAINRKKAPRQVFYTAAMQRRALPDDGSAGLALRTQNFGYTFRAFHDLERRPSRTCIQYDCERAHRWEKAAK